MFEQMEKSVNAMPSHAVRLTLSEQLSLERERLTKRIVEIDEVLTAMREHPGVEKVIDLIFRQGLR